MTDCIHLPHWAAAPGLFGPLSRLPGGATIEQAELAILEGAVPGGIIRRGRIAPGFAEGLSDPFLLVHGTGIRSFDAPELLDEMTSRHAGVLVVAHPRPGAGRSLLSDPDGRLSSFGSDQASNLRDSGVWLVGREIAGAGAAALSSPHAFLAAAMESGAALYSECLARYCRVVESPADFLALCGDVLGGRIPQAAGLEAIPPIVDPSAAIGEGTLIEGLVWIDGGARIGRDCRIEDSVVLWGARVGEGSRLRNTLVMPGCRVAAFSDSSDKYIEIIGG